jgi:2'-5' RNA ligase
MPNWIQAKINTGRLVTRLPSTVQDMIKTEETNQHMTLLYGCSNDKEYIMNIVQKYLPLKLKFGTIRTGDRVKEVLFIGIEENKELNNLFWELYNNDTINVDKIHGLIDGKFDPHLTIGYLYDGLQEREEVKNILGHKLIDFEVEIGVKDIEVVSNSN